MIDFMLTIIVLEVSTTSPIPQMAGVVATIVNQKADVIFSQATSVTTVGTEMPITSKSMFWIASCTKLFTAVATMQLLEQEKLELDDEEIVERLCPELDDLMVLDGVNEKGETKYVKKEKAITVRMLLSHTGMLTSYYSL